MTPLDTATGHSDRRHTHDRSAGPGDARCPYCNSVITRKEFDKIRARIESQERARIGKVEADLKARFARETAKAEATKKGEIVKAIKEATKTVETKLRLARANQDAMIAA